MQPGQNAALYVSFTPMLPTDYSETFHLVCDNCQVKKFVVHGRGCLVDMSVNMLDGRQLAPGELERPLWFGEVDAGSSHERRISVTNSGGVPLPFVWQQTERKMLTREV